MPKTSRTLVEALIFPLLLTICLQNGMTTSVAAATTTSQPSTTTAEASTTSTQVPTTTSPAASTSTQAASTTTPEGTTTTPEETTTTQPVTTSSTPATTTSQPSTTTAEAGTTSTQVSTTTSPAASTSTQAATTTTTTAPEETSTSTQAATTTTAPEETSTSTQAATATTTTAPVETTTTQSVTATFSRADYPTINSPPEFIFETMPASYNGKPYTDYYFICRINYIAQAPDDSSQFEVTLIADWWQFVYPRKTADVNNLDVIFNSSEVWWAFDRTLSCAVNSYWRDQPWISSGFAYSYSSYFVGISFSADTYSYSYHWWGWTWNFLMMYEYAKYVTLSYNLTVPVSCPPCTVTYTISDNSGLLMSNCSITFSSDDPPGTVKTLRIRAVQMPGTYSRWTAISYNQPSTEVQGSSWDSYQLSPVYALIIDWYSSGVCYASGDPHFQTFDGLYYNVYFAADFILWRRYGTSFLDIQIRTWKCWPNVACSCAVVVREDNNVLGINSCGMNGAILPINYLDANTSGASIQISNDGYSYTIMMPSGTYVNVWAWCWSSSMYWWWGQGEGGCMMSITVVPTSDPGSTSEGLCGNDNGNMWDDLIPRGSTTPDVLSEPVQLAASYMVPPEDSLINGHRYYPKCVTKNITEESLPTFCDCSNLSETSCSAVTAQTTTMKTATVFSTQGTDSCVKQLSRRKRDASGSVSPSSANDNVINPNDIPVPVQEPAPAQPLRGNLTWPTAKNITQEMAQNMCKLPILESPVYHLCVNFTQDSFDSIVSSCVDDLQLLDDPDTAVRGVLRRFHEACVLGVQQSDNRTSDEAMSSRNESLAANQTSFFSANDTNQVTQLSSAALEILQSIVSNLCPGEPECNGNGTCINSTCNCYPGFIGVDCSVNIHDPPVIYSSRFGSVCDSRQQPCTRVSLLASGFSLSSNFTCRIIDSGVAYYTDSYPVSRMEVQCALPISPADINSTKPVYTWSVSISNDNVTFSNSISLLVFDSICFNCLNDSSSCTQKTDTCLIDNKCFLSGEVNAGDNCLECNPLLDETAWSRVTTNLQCTPPTTARSTVRTTKAVNDHCVTAQGFTRHIGESWLSQQCRRVHCVSCKACNTGGKLIYKSQCNAAEVCLNNVCKLRSGFKKKCQKILDKCLPGRGKPRLQKRHVSCKKYPLFVTCLKHRS